MKHLAGQYEHFHRLAPGPKISAWALALPPPGPTHLSAASQVGCPCSCSCLCPSLFVLEISIPSNAQTFFRLLPCVVGVVCAGVSLQKPMSVEVASECTSQTVGSLGLRLRGERFGENHGGSYPEVCRWFETGWNVRVRVSLFSEEAPQFPTGCTPSRPPAHEVKDH